MCSRCIYVKNYIASTCLLLMSSSKQSWYPNIIEYVRTETELKKKEISTIQHLTEMHIVHNSFVQRELPTSTRLIMTQKTSLFIMPPRRKGWIAWRASAPRGASCQMIWSRVCFPSIVRKCQPRGSMEYVLLPPRLPGRRVQPRTLIGDCILDGRRTDAVNLYLICTQQNYYQAMTQQTIVMWA